MLFNTQRWSLHDGPGIRTTIFFKGCPLRCRWCSNPESWSFEKQLTYLKTRCTRCGACVDVCSNQANTLGQQWIELDEKSCVQCFKCVEVCPNQAREIIGDDYSVERLMTIIEKDRVFYASTGGGVTFSGGEPFAQMTILKTLVQNCYDMGINTAVETSGFFSWNEAKDIIRLLDIVYIDLKHINSRKHIELTTVSNKKILENIIHLDRNDSYFTIRMPLIKKVNDDEASIDLVGQFIKQNLKNPVRIELLRYHKLGLEKYGNLRMPYDSKMEPPGLKATEAIMARLRSLDIDVVCPDMDS